MDLGSTDDGSVLPKFGIVWSPSLRNCGYDFPCAYYEAGTLQWCDLHTTSAYTAAGRGPVDTWDLYSADSFSHRNCRIQLKSVELPDCSENIRIVFRAFVTADSEVVNSRFNSLHFSFQMVVIIRIRLLKKLNCIRPNTRISIWYSW